MNSQPTQAIGTVGPVLFEDASRNHTNLRFATRIEAYARKDLPEVGQTQEVIWKMLNITIQGRRAKRYKENLAALLTNLYVAWRTPGNPFLRLPLGYGAYAKGRRLHSLHYRYTPLKVLIDLLDANSLIERHRGYFDGEKGKQTRIRATLKLVRVFLAFRFPLQKLRLTKELVLLRNKDKKRIDISKGKLAQLAKHHRQHLGALNDFHGSAIWELAMPEEVFIEYFLRREKKIDPPNPTRKLLHRVFNLNFDHGGRFYGIWPQGIPKELRRYILINGQRTHERDYVSLHPSILYAWEQAEITGDPYLIDGYGKAYRKPIKLLFNMALNASSKDSAFKAFRREINSSELKLKYAHCALNEWLTPAYEAIHCRHNPIKKYLSSGVGIKLQRIDSEMAEFVLFRLMQLGVPSIPIHDSFIVERQNEPLLTQIMKEASKVVVGVEIATDRNDFQSVHEGYFFQ